MILQGSDRRADELGPLALAIGKRPLRGYGGDEGAFGMLSGTEEDVMLNGAPRSSLRCSRKRSRAPTIHRRYNERISKSG